MKRVITTVILTFIFLNIGLNVRGVPSKPIGPLHPNYETEKGNLVQYRDGDILIGVLIKAHKRGTGDKCSTVLEDGMQRLEAINMIVDQVNANSSILPGLKLGTVMVDTCDVDTHALQRAVLSFLPYFWNQQANASASKPVFAGVIGAFSSAVSIQTASLLQIYKIPQVSPSSTNPSLSNKNRFPYFFRVVPSDTFQARAMITLVKQRKWNYISIVYEDEAYGIGGAREITSEAAKQGICVASSQVIPRSQILQNFTTTVNKLLEVKKARAVIIFAKRHQAEMLIEAAHVNPQSRGYFQWIGSDSWSGAIPTNDATMNYSESLQGAITFRPKANVIKRLDAYMANLTLGQHLNGNYSEPRNPWFAEYIVRKSECSLKNDETTDGCQPETGLDASTFKTITKIQTTADATLSLVAALQRYQQLFCPGEMGCSSMRGLAGTNKLAVQIYSILKNITYTGVNGDLLSFDSNQDGKAIFNLEMFRKNQLDKPASWIKAAVYHNDKISWYINSSSVLKSDVQSVCSQPCKWNQAAITASSACCWHCATCSGNTYVGINGSKCIECPKGFRSNPTKRGCVPLALKTTSFITSFSLSSMGLASMGFFLTMLIGGIFYRHRDSAIVKASGKGLCVFVLGGAILCFVDSFVLSAPATVATCCVSRVLLAVGPSVMYAGLLTKTMRVVIIFRTKFYLNSHMKTFLQTKFLVMFAIALVFLQAFVITIWFAVSPASVVITYDTGDGVAFRSCNDVHHLSIVAGLVYPFILIGTCTVLAATNRNIPTAFNETKYIGFTMYVTCVTWLAFLPIFITNSSNIPLKVATVGICLDLSAIIVLVCLFGFRCYVIIFRPEQNTSKSVLPTTPKM